MSLTLFAERKALGDQWETEVFNAVKETPGWNIWRFDQAMIDGITRKLIQQIDTPMRWLPDFLAQRIEDGKSILLEAKWTDTEEHRSNFDIEKKSLQAVLKHGQYHAMPVYFVFPGFWVMEAREVAKFATEGRFNGNGSGKPFILIPQWRAQKKLATLLMEP